MNFSLSRACFPVLACRSPLIQVPASFLTTTFIFRSLYASRSLSSMFQMSSGASSLQIRSSRFTKFLDSVVKIRGVQLNGEDFIESKTNSFSSSFNITDCRFLNNTNSDVGSAISVMDNSGIIGKIENCIFNYNKAGFGGAIFFLDKSGQLEISDCSFTSNTASATGAHVFINTEMQPNISRSIFKFAHGITSIQFASDDVNATFYDCNFFQNDCGLGFSKNSKANFISCCFMNYKNDNFEFINDKFINSNGSTGTTYEFVNCCINFKLLSEEIIGNINIDDEMNKYKSDESNETYCLKCRIVPLPTPTVNAKWNSTASIEALVAMGVAIVISIIGIVLIACGYGAPPPDEFDSSSTDTQEGGNVLSGSGAELEDIPREGA